jgi:hypothetical protein
MLAGIPGTPISRLAHPSGAPPSIFQAGLPPRKTLQFTVTLTVDVVFPKALIVYSVYVVVAVGVTETLDPRAAPTCGVITTRDAPVTCHDSVTAVPELTEAALLVNEVICGAAPVGTLLCV